MVPQVPIILCDENTAPAFSVFNPNDWDAKSKPIVQSCAAHYGLLLYTAKKIKDIFKNAEALCSPKFNDLIVQWKKSQWDLAKCTHWVDIPEVHLSIHSFLSTVKTFLDIIVQLISSEGVASERVHGFHRRGDQIGGKLLVILKNNIPKTKEHLAALLYDLIIKHKEIWIDEAINFRDFFIHPEKGLATVMFALELTETAGELKLVKILKPSINGKEFDYYAEKLLTQIEEFSKIFIKHIKSA